MSRKYFYVDEGDVFMREARRVAETASFDNDWPTGVVVVKNGKIIGRGANGSEYHVKFGCRRKELGIPTGERYDLCEGCDPKNHGEPRAIEEAKKQHEDTEGADLFMWGHWWCCEPCWEEMEEVGIKKVYLLKDAQVVFNSKRKVVRHKYVSVG
ncbi:MAG: hypothetical protein HY381_02590 [Candidatus Chisholmbacteria bacterium]|nr:hypothetical protein [Candidatus Chisholmbacteria bacterium]